MTINDAVDVEFQIKRHLQAGKRLITYVRERSRWTEMFVRNPFTNVPGLDLSDQILLKHLLQLEQDGTVIRCENVHPFDPSEYRVHWTLAEKVA